ncbi:MerR-like DNA binding protein [Roseiarcus fermentans]|uniref:MerR-like DNA binding protein n=1 Tax=Roseiarcus fermentans TaxID=1473586 RepID=A0A366FQF2_9HYPH|nr:MerR family transcriptional regulator [Roseiarcus fermentans]RBP16848.1 MerR-like DNA binding protein [Roseiarcus fermentans]
MEKSPEAFRTISEVADTIDLPQHVLRFWETRFPQIRPLKRAGGRRYYRPDDVERLRLIKRLLYDEGYTIKGVQKLFKEQGVQALTSATTEPRLLSQPSEPAARAQAAREPDPGLAAGPRPDPAAPPESVAPPVATRAFDPGEIAALRGALAEIVEAARALRLARSGQAGDQTG